MLGGVSVRTRLASKGNGNALGPSLGLRRSMAESTPARKQNRSKKRHESGCLPVHLSTDTTVKLPRLAFGGVRVLASYVRCFSSMVQGQGKQRWVRYKYISLSGTVVSLSFSLPIFRCVFSVVFLALVSGCLHQVTSIYHAITQLFVSRISTTRNGKEGRKKKRREEDMGSIDASSDPTSNAAAAPIAGNQKVGSDSEMNTATQRRPVTEEHVRDLRAMVEGAGDGSVLLVPGDEAYEMSLRRWSRAAEKKAVRRFSYRLLF